MYPQIIPLGEESSHIPVQGCPCKPKFTYIKQQRVLFHYAYDKREVWLSIEKLLGITCWEHGLFVSPLYKKGEQHGHFKRPPLHFEYPHKKIDPR